MVPSGRNSGSSSNAGMAAMVEGEPEARIKIAYEEYVRERAGMGGEDELTQPERVI